MFNSRIKLEYPVDADYLFQVMERFAGVRPNEQLRTIYTAMAGLINQAYGDGCAAGAAALQGDTTVWS